MEISTRPNKSNSDPYTRRISIQIGMDQNIGASGNRLSMEDASFAENLTTAGGSFITLAIVADGIGGASSGERASNLTVESIADSVRQSAGEDFPQILEAAFIQANGAVYKESLQEPHKSGMGSTAVAVIVHKDRIYLASVGDSRAYLVRGDAVIQLTSDHNWGEEMIRSGKLRPQEVARSQSASFLVRSIGNEPDVQVDLGVYWNARESESTARTRQGTRLKAGDHIVVCSDGLFHERPDGRGHFVETSEFPLILSRNSALQAARTLISKAMGRNVNDNVTVVILKNVGDTATIIKMYLFWCLIIGLVIASIVARVIFIP
jgi:PPM family protein phosphatase